MFQGKTQVFTNLRDICVVKRDESLSTSGLFLLDAKPRLPTEKWTGEEKEKG